MGSLLPHSLQCSAILMHLCIQETKVGLTIPILHDTFWATHVVLQYWEWGPINHMKSKKEILLSRSAKACF